MRVIRPCEIVHKSLLVFIKPLVRVTKEQLAIRDERIAKLEDAMSKTASASRVVEIQDSLESKIAAIAINQRRGIR
jgi:hypothetical protein